jgi:hypothetical protein
MDDLSVRLRCLGKVLSSGLWGCVVYKKLIDFREECTASIFRAENITQDRQKLYLCYLNKLLFDPDYQVNI